MTKARQPTVYVALRERLGREPTNAELKSEVQRIIHEGFIQGVEQRNRRRTP